MDRVTASRMGVAAVDALMQDKSSIMIGLVNNQINEMHFSQSVKMHKSVNQELYELAHMLI
jgi:6-phosphofructokinase 1